MRLFFHVSLAFQLTEHLLDFFLFAFELFDQIVFLFYGFFPLLDASFCLRFECLEVLYKLLS
jgi:hypothetical protein